MIIMKYSREYLIKEIERFIKEHNDKYPQSTDMKVKSGFPSLSAYINTFGSWTKALEAYENTLFPEQVIEPDLVNKYTLICEDEIYKLCLKYPTIPLAIIVEIFEISYQLGISAEAEAIDLQFMQDMYL